MSHSIETATSGRAKCRGCGQSIAKGEFRLAERLPNPYAEEGDMTLWFHPKCGALKRPEVFLEALDETPVELEDCSAMKESARYGLQHRRLPRLDGGQLSPTGRARCRCCREFIAKGTWRVGLVYYEEGRFNPSGYIHLGCSKEYFGTTDIVDRLFHFSPSLSSGEIEEIASELQRSG